MIIEVPGSREPQAWQVIAHIHRVEKQMPKSVLEGMLRELVEHHLYLDQNPDVLQEQVSQALQRRGVIIKRLELRALDVRQSTQRDGLMRQWWEILVEDLSTADGFGVTLDVVARAHLSPQIASHHGSLLVLRSTLTAALQVELANLFQHLELESLLSQREVWTAKLLNRVVEGNFDKVLDQLHSEKIGPGHNAGLETLWIADLKVKARENAFRPASRPRYGDPLAHFRSWLSEDPLLHSQPDERES